LGFHDPMPLDLNAPMPYNITTLTMPNMHDLRITWRGGIQTLE